MSSLQLLLLLSFLIAAAKRSLGQNSRITLSVDMSGTPTTQVYTHFIQIKRSRHSTGQEGKGCAARMQLQYLRPALHSQQLVSGAVQTPALNQMLPPLSCSLPQDWCPIAWGTEVQPLAELLCSQLPTLSYPVPFSCFSPSPIAASSWL